MSRIFEALQKSEEERSGVSFPAPLSLATDLLQNAERQRDESFTAPTREELAAEEQSLSQRPEELDQFPQLPINLWSGSRLICLTNQESLGAEKFRFLAVKLRQIQQARPLKRLLVTSSIPEEGKSMVCGNLAAVLARKKQQRTLLLEGDLRRPVLASRFGLGKVPGLTEWLEADSAPVSNIYQLAGAGLWFMPAGAPPENPLELMQSGKLAGLLAQLSQWFDWIVIDTPPLLPLADTSLWSRLADGVLLVAREGVTQKRQLQRGLEVVEQTKLLGMVLNSSSNSEHDSYYQRYGPLAPQTAEKF